jgi:hypothetical protein
LASGATAGDELNVYAFSTFNLADVYTKAQSDARYPQIDTNTLFVDTANDRVGIGTSSPSSKLHVAGGADSTIRNTASSGSSWFVGSNSSGYILHNESNTPMLFTTNGTERMRIDSSGRVTMPSQPAFYAMKNNETVISSTNPIVFEDIYVNTGSCYNTSNGRFTAPVAGVYQFSATFLMVAGVGRLAFYKNGSFYGSGESQTYSGSVGSGEIPHTSNIIVSLAANDYITVVGVITSGYVYGGTNSHNGFSGFLIG